MAPVVNVVVTHTALEPLSVSIKEAQRLTSESRSTIYNRIADGVYEARKSGTRLLILYESIKRHLEGLPRAKVKPQRSRKPRARRRLRKRQEQNDSEQRA
jgi:predicted DNA-binding transcriptional regulator AlpA